MPFIPGQGVGLIAGLVMIAFLLIYLALNYRIRARMPRELRRKGDFTPALQNEFAKEPMADEEE